MRDILSLEHSIYYIAEHFLFTQFTYIQQISKIVHIIAEGMLIYGNSSSIMAANITTVISAVIATVTSDCLSFNVGTPRTRL